MDTETELRKLLRLRSGTADILVNRESSQLEFKESFNLGSRSKYARTMAAFANNKGGFIVFGIEPAPHRVKGVNAPNFDACDPAKLTEFLNAHFSPELGWELCSLEVFDCRLGFIYTHEATEKPVVAIANSGEEICESDIYYRYKGQSATIHYPELRQIIEERLVRERRAWMQHFQAISRAGPTNVGVLDTIHGQLYGGGPPFLIDEKLLRKLKFIRQGRFSEVEGEPTLMLIGDVQPVAGIEKEKQVSVGIHAEDLFTAFLAQRPLDEGEARSYLRETSYQPTHYVPLHYFVKLAKLSREKAVDIIKTSTSTFTSTKAGLARRLTSNESLQPIGTVATWRIKLKGLTRASFLAALQAAKTEKERRSLLVTVLAHRPGLIKKTLAEVALMRVCEAVTHLPKKRIIARKTELLDLLLSIFTDHFPTMTSLEKSAFRKAIAVCDEAESGEN